MSKIKIVESIGDNLLLSAGRGKVAKNDNLTEGKILNLDSSKVKVTFLSSEIKEDEEFSYEIAKIRVDSNQKTNSLTTIREAIREGAIAKNHQVSIPLLEDSVDQKTLNTNKSSYSYSFSTVFNYVSQDYDELQTSVEETNLLSAIDRSAKKNFLGFKKMKSPSILNLSRGQKMRNFVQPQSGFGGVENEVPYYNKLTINMSTKGELSKFIENTDIYDDLLNSYLKSQKNVVEVNIQKGRALNKNVGLEFYNIKDFFEHDEEIDENFFYGINKQKHSSMGLRLRKHLLKGFLKNLFKNNFRTFEEIYNGLDCGTEGFCYSLEKYDGVALDSTKIQTIYSPSGVESTQILDTQIKYGKQYAYKAYAHIAIVGNSYSYRNVRYIEEDGVYYATAEVVNEPNFIIAPFELLSEQKVVIQPPPVRPQVTFKTESNSNSEIKLYLSPTKTETIEDFIRITEKDDSQMQEMDLFFKEKNGLFKFKTEKQSGLFEIFRASEPPTSYLSFAGSKLGEIRMPFSTGDAIFLDSIKVNKPYYYMARQVNEKGLVSNPTKVFKVTLLQDADESKVMVDTFEFPKQVNSVKRSDLKNLLQVRPATEQVFFNENQEVLFEKDSLKGTLEDLKLGIAEKSIWGRKIKLRVRSKTSGKLIDLNISFNLSKNKTKEEF